MPPVLMLSTSDGDVARTLLKPLSEQTCRLASDGDDAAAREAVELRFGAMAIKRGALETVVELAAGIDWGSLAGGVASGLIVNWVWSRIKSLGERAADAPPVTVVVKTDRGTVVLNTSSRAAIEVSMAEAIGDERP